MSKPYLIRRVPDGRYLCRWRTGNRLGWWPTRGGNNAKEFAALRFASVDEARAYWAEHAHKLSGTPGVRVVSGASPDVAVTVLPGRPKRRASA